jgi:hypothetical protein
MERRDREKAKGYVGESFETVKRPERFVGSLHESANCFGTVEGVPKLRRRSSKRARRTGLLAYEVNAARGNTYGTATGRMEPTRWCPEGDMERQGSDVCGKGSPSRRTRRRESALAIRFAR